MFNIVIREMRIKIIMRYHFMSSRRAIIKRQIIMCIGECVEKTTLMLLVRMWNSAAVWKNVWQYSRQLSKMVPNNPWFLLFISLCDLLPLNVSWTYVNCFSLTEHSKMGNHFCYKIREDCDFHLFFLIFSLWWS